MNDKSEKNIENDIEPGYIQVLIKTYKYIVKQEVPAGKFSKVKQQNKFPFRIQILMELPFPLPFRHFSLKRAEWVKIHNVKANKDPCSCADKVN